MAHLYRGKPLAHGAWECPCGALIGNSNKCLSCGTLVMARGESGQVLTLVHGIETRTVLPDEIDEDPPLHAEYDAWPEVKLYKVRIAELEAEKREREMGDMIRDGESLEVVRKRHVAFIEKQSARIKELEAQHAAQVETIAGLQSRVAELTDVGAYARETDGEVEEINRTLNAKLDVAREGERRKIEQCDRLEKALVVHRDRINEMRDERDAAHGLLGQANAENARLRREMGCRK